MAWARCPEIKDYCPSPKREVDIFTCGPRIRNHFPLPRGVGAFTYGPGISDHHGISLWEKGEKVGVALKMGY